ncbi:ABC transporter permease [Vacuolonema iberomarrocanum]|uniref:ABC transporter permease n=1 Tax=Vacuolonema iberomarrocanum TaxID=3454632 RepID=UPI001A03FFC7|nr:ABC transporter permease [filamentous cyanobacterium LEGE 07170]
MATSPPIASRETASPASVFQRLKQRATKLVEPLVLLLPAGVWLLLLLVIPTLMILQLSLLPDFKPGNPLPSYGLGNYLKILQDDVYLRVIFRSFIFAIASTLLCLVLGFPVAYWIALMAPQRWRNLLLLAFVLPLWTSSLLRSYAWITILRPTGVLNTFLNSVGLPSLQILNTQSAVVLGLAYNFLPYMVLILYASLEKLDRRLLEAAADLGAPPTQVFAKITVPQSLPGIAAGCLLVFITSLGDFVVPELLGGASSMTMARLVYNQFLGAARNWGFGSGLSMLLILAVSLTIALLLKYGDRKADTLV